MRCGARTQSAGPACACKCLNAAASRLLACWRCASAVSAGDDIHAPLWQPGDAVRPAGLQPLPQTLPRLAAARAQPSPTTSVRTSTARRATLQAGPRRCAPVQERGGSACAALCGPLSCGPPSPHALWGHPRAHWMRAAAITAHRGTAHSAAAPEWPHRPPAPPRRRLQYQRGLAAPQTLCSVRTPARASDGSAGGAVVAC